MFYVVLATLTAMLLLPRSSTAPQTNANGVLTEVGKSRLGVLLLVAAALAFVAFGLIRLAGALTDERHGWLRRLGTAGQAVVYLGMAIVVGSFLLGQRSAGSEQQQRRSADAVLALPGGRWLLAAAGVAILAVCAWQFTVAAKGHFADALHLEQMGRDARTLTILTARVGIPARALAFLPVGVLLLVGAARAEPNQVKGLDALLRQLTVSVWGRILVSLVAVGFVVFAAYSFLEARYRRVSSGA